jgi:hypothetical protein
MEHEVFADQVGLAIFVDGKKLVDSKRIGEEVKEIVDNVIEEYS